MNERVTTLARPVAPWGMTTVSGGSRRSYGRASCKTVRGAVLSLTDRISGVGPAESYERALTRLRVG
jgi:hypothetical protein